MSLSASDVQRLVAKKNDVQAVIFHLNQELKALKEQLSNDFGVTSRKEADEKIARYRAEIEVIDAKLIEASNRINDAYDKLKSSGAM